MLLSNCDLLLVITFKISFAINVPTTPVTVPKIPSSWHRGDNLGSEGIKHLKHCLLYTSDAADES